MIFIDAAVCCEMRRGAWLDSKSCRIAADLALEGHVKNGGGGVRDESKPTGRHRHDRQPLIRQIRIYDDAGNVIQTHEHAGDFKEC